MDSHENITRFDDVAPVSIDRGALQGTRQRLGVAAGTVEVGLSRYVLDAGQRAMPAHAHADQEELIVVLEGDGEVELGNDRYPLRPGCVVARPPGSGIAHALIGGAGGMTYLAYGTRRAHDVCFYPRTQKVDFGNGMIFRLEAVGYFEGES